MGCMHDEGCNVQSTVVNGRCANIFHHTLILKISSLAKAFFPLIQMLSYKVKYQWLPKRHAKHHKYPSHMS